MSFQFSQFAVFAAFFIGLIAFSAYRVRTVRRSGIGRHIKGLLFAVKAAVGTMSRLVVGLVGLLATGVVTSEENGSEQGDLTGDYNFRTRKFDNGTDPYGWYEEDL